MSKSVQHPGVFRQFVGVCPECGAACTGTYKFWYVASNGEDGLECDQSVLDDALAKVLESHLGVGVYSALPDFMQAYNEGRDYFREPGPASLNVDDFSRTLDLLERECEIDPDEHTRIVVEQLRRLLDAAKAMNAAVIFLDD